MMTMYTAHIPGASKYKYSSQRLTVVMQDTENTVSLHLQVYARLSRLVGG